MGGGQELQVTAVTTDTPESPAPANNAKGTDEAQGCASQDRIPTSRPGLGNIVDKYGGVDSGWSTLVLLMVPEPSSQEYQTASWAAFFFIRCDDVARLMREGFFWGPEDVVPEEGFYFPTANPAWLGLGLRCGRAWSLADKSHGQNPTWVGHLEVAASSLTAVNSFQLQSLAREHISIAHAKNARDQPVYGYIRRWPGDCHNYIYDHMPLPGWWPWPKERVGSAVADPNMGTAAWEDELIFSPPSMAPHVIYDDVAHAATAANQASSCVVM